MKQILAAFFKVFGFIFGSLKFPALLIFVLIIILSSFFIYDQYHTYQERKIGRELIKNLNIEGSCKQIVNPDQKIDVKFTFTNGNNEAISLNSLQIEKGLFESENKKYLEVIAIEPSFSKIKIDNSQSREYQFENTLAQPSKDLSIIVSLKAKSRQESGANPHTIVVYSGKMLFEFEHEISIEAPCQIQVRYAD